MGLYGRLTVRGDPAPPGTVVDVVDAAGTVAAWTETQHSGSYGYLPVYLDDPVSERDEGAEIGEWLDVRVDGQYTGYRIQWLEFGDLVELDLWLDPPTAVSPTGRPQVFSLQQNYPNPFNAGTTIGYQLAEEATVRLSIYGLNGQVVRRLVRQLQRPGEHSAVWDGRDDAEIPVTSGCYLYRLRAGTFEQTRKLLLLK